MGCMSGYGWPPDKKHNKHCNQGFIQGGGEPSPPPIQVVCKLHNIANTGIKVRYIYFS